MVRAAGSSSLRLFPTVAPSAAQARRTSRNRRGRIATMKGKLLGLSILASAAFAAPALAHHSFAMFDPDKSITLKGTVKEFEWNNPHVWIRVMVVDPATGKPVQYALEMG